MSRNDNAALPIENCQRTHLSKQCTLVLSFTLGCGDGPDEDTEHGLGNHIGNGISNLLHYTSSVALNPHHLDDVHTWVCQPRHGCQESCCSNGALCRLILWCAGGSVQAHEQLEDNVGERNHGQAPPQPTAIWIVLDLSRVAKCHHQCRRHTKLERQGRGLFGLKSHAH